MTSAPPTQPTGTATVTDLGLRRTPPLPGQVLGWPAPAPQPVTQGTLALDLAALVPTPATHALSAVPDPAPPDDALHARARRFLQAVVEMVAADRPVTQLLRWATAEVYTEVCRRADAALATTDSTHRSRTGRPKVVSVHVSRPGDGVAEVAGHVRHAGRSRALAARLEHRRDRWVCTALQLG